MKIAIPSQGGTGLDDTIAEHFGRARFYTLVQVQDKQITGFTVEPVPFDEHQPGDIPNWLNELGVDVVISHGMGPRAVEHFETLGIKSVVGASGRISDVVEAFLNSTLSTTPWQPKHEH